MNIFYHEKAQEFHLQNESVSYIMKVLKNGQAVLLMSLKQTLLNLVRIYKKQIFKLSIKIFKLKIMKPS